MDVLAEIESSILRLTNAISRLVGRAFYPNQIQFKNSTVDKVFFFLLLLLLMLFLNIQSLVVISLLLNFILFKI
ncbi:hypothetical protein AQUCO_00600002v1 [Aquilegia coerulea]|uniref:Uncharacterized protein n=1 Tax=Aquilegia coerulea TaxID=218851 RepID=A0A2G5EN50_AQUCA|nr:hypothetical protein AQUCO_00600002v1 [Aquilegia coerulea]